MDKGAHFHRCDFQTHTPRDIQWTGSKPVSEEDRKSFAQLFVKYCRDNKLDAVAITDHHDFTFFKYIKRASQDELQQDGSVVTAEKRIVVFPGLELSLAAPPCQALLILDSDFPEDQFIRILNLLSINPNDENEPSTAQTNKIPSDVVNGFDNLYIKLDTINILKGKYIILPNVTDGGHKTLLRSGFDNYYKKMPCVGGYVDGIVSSSGTGNQSIVNGQDINYGNKSIALFQTSDNRNQNFEDLGKYSTWVKWAEPTAEALRQACLAKESRISQVEPELPQIFIESIDVTNSKFLGSFSLNFNNQYNALIGGRGTGKSTLLEYLRWGLCDQSTNMSDLEDLSIIEKKRQSLIQKTLIDFKGEVRITMRINNIPHIIKRNSETKEILLKIGDLNFQEVKEDDIRRLAPIQAYSQKQLSDVGVKTDELKRFIEQPISSELETLKFKINEANKLIKSSYNRLINKKIIEQEVENYNLEIQSLTTQVDSLRKSLTGISSEDQEIINKKQKYDIEQTIINNSKGELEIFEKNADSLLNLLKLYPEPLGNIDSLENKDLIKNISDEIENKFIEIKSVSETFKRLFNEDGLKKFNKLLNEWETKNKSYLNQYEEAKKKTLSSQKQLLQIQKIEERLNEITKLLSDKRTALKQIGNPLEEFTNHQKTWHDCHKEKLELLNKEASHFGQLSKNFIKAEIAKSIDLKNIKIILKSIYEGTRIQEARIDALLENVKQSTDPIKTYNTILEELRLLTELKISENKTNILPDTKILTTCGYTDDHRSKLSKKFTTDDWLKLSTTELEFSPEFSYQTNNTLGDVIPFEEASAGQQATALLTVLLNQPGPPLIIDQPEDDIDNKAIEDIIQTIWEAKKKRQLIFTSHNANLVVNGDSELVICCDYRDSSSQTRGTIKYEGSIDFEDIRKEIVLVMEGGIKAFKLRKEKFGF